jgi:hypothetical protein
MLETTRKKAILGLPFVRSVFPKRARNPRYLRDTQTGADETSMDKIGPLHATREKIRSIVHTHDVHECVATCPE